MKEILELKNDFNCVKVLRGDILNVFETLDSKLMVLKKIYINLLGLHNQSEHMFGIDSFYFQNKLIENEFENLKDIQHYIENRMYCEYYQLHILVQEYVEKEVVSENVRNKIAVRKKYPAYKNLDPRRIYDFRLVAELQDHIIISIMELETYRQAKVAELETDNAQSKLGLNIGNLVNSHRFYNALLNEKISMFIRYLQVFHEHHTKYFTRLHIKAKLIMGIINEDIQIKQFNPTGSNALPHTDMDSPLSGVSQKTVKSEEQTIKSFVKYEDSRDDLKAALDTIVSNITDEKVYSHSIRAVANNTPTDFIGDDDEDVKHKQNIITFPGNSEKSLDIESDISCEMHSESQDSNANESIMTECDEGNCAFTALDVGKRVLVEGYDSIGTLRFVGKHNVKNVTRCGVEFDEEIGKNNGTIDGHIYFEAMDNRGVLVSPRKVSFVDI